MTDTISFDPTPEDPPRRRFGRRIVISAVAAVLLVGLAGAAFAVYNKLDGGGTQPHDVLPASTQIYARIDVDPSASQKIELFQLIRKFPDVAEALGIESDDQDVRKLIFDAITEGSCDSLDFEDDVEPWLGERMGVSASVADETLVLAVQLKGGEGSVNDLEKALAACSDEAVKVGYLDGYAIVSDSQSNVDDSIKEATSSPLGDKQAFVDDFEALGSQGVVSAWFDITAIADIPELQDALGDQLGDLTATGSGAMAIRVDDGALELAILGGEASDDDPGTDALASLPSDTVVGLSLQGLGDQLSEGFESGLKEFQRMFEGELSSEFGAEFEGEDFDPSAFETDLDDMFAAFEDSTGLRIPDDLETLLGDSVVLQIGASNLETIPTLGGPDDVAALDVALRMESDSATAVDLAQRLASLAEEVGIELAVLPTDDGAILATNTGAAEAVAEPKGDLGSSDAFRSVMPDGAASGGVFINLGAILDKLLDSNPPDDVREGIESAKALSAIGFSSTEQDNGRLMSRFRISFR